MTERNTIKNLRSLILVTRLVWAALSHINWVDPSQDFVTILSNMLIGCIYSFASSLRTCSMVEAKLWGIYHGLEIAWSKVFIKYLFDLNGFHQIIV